MLKGFAIKKTIYQGSDGVQVNTIQEVKTFDNEQEARIAAENSGGQVVNVHRRDKRTVKPSKRNQQWMKG